MPYLPRYFSVKIVDRSLQAREATINLIKFYLQRVGNRMKQQDDKRRSDQEFFVGDLVHVKLQPYR